MRVQRVTYGDVTNVTPIAFNTITIQDPNLEPGQQVIRQEGENGERTDTYHVTYVDGQQEDAALTSSTVTKIAVDRIIAIGPDKPKEEPKEEFIPDLAYYKRLNQKLLDEDNEYVEKCIKEIREYEDRIGKKTGRIVFKNGKISIRNLLNEIARLS